MESGKEKEKEFGGKRGVWRRKRRSVEEKGKRVEEKGILGVWRRKRSVEEKGKECGDRQEA